MWDECRDGCLVVISCVFRQYNQSVLDVKNMLEKCFCFNQLRSKKTDQTAAQGPEEQDGGWFTFFTTTGWSKGTFRV